jgi:hypothetical protein
MNPINVAIQIKVTLIILVHIKIFAEIFFGDDLS